MDTERLDNLRALLVEKAISYGPKLVVATLFVVAGSLTARWVGATFSHWLEKRQMEPPVRLLLVRIVRLVVFALFMILAMQNLGVELMPLIAGLGVAGVGVGLALQGVLQNLVAGLTIIFTKPFRVGEYIELLHVQGEVISIELFSTALRHPDQSRVVIPNRKIVGEILHNYGKIRQLDLQVGVAYDTDLNQAIALAREVVEANPRVLRDIQPVIGVSKLAESAVTLAVRPWVKVPDYVAAGAEINQALLARLQAARIRIPSPQREIRVINPSGASAVA
ncbi:MAG TPA: mechanosensitive ion channel protein MscS [Verrucomicrobiales bacterium]|nr:mechanosensitive ion channel protein MscS [Verrucomicrobiales bacterium]